MKKIQPQVYCNFCIAVFSIIASTPAECRCICMLPFGMKTCSLRWFLALCSWLKNCNFNGSWKPFWKNTTCLISCKNLNTGLSFVKTMWKWKYKKRVKLTRFQTCDCSSVGSSSSRLAKQFPNEPYVSRNSSDRKLATSVAINAVL